MAIWALFQQFYKTLYYVWMVYRTDEGVFRCGDGYVLTYHHLETNLVYVKLTQKTISFRYRNRKTRTITYGKLGIYSGLWEYVSKRFGTGTVIAISEDWL